MYKIHLLLFLIALTCCASSLIEDRKIKHAFNNQRFKHHLDEDSEPDSNINALAENLRASWLAEIPAATPTVPPPENDHPIEDNGGEAEDITQGNGGDRDDSFSHPESNHKSMNLDPSINGPPNSDPQAINSFPPITENAPSHAPPVQANESQASKEQAPASKPEPAPANQPQAAQAPSSKPSPAPAGEPQAAQAPASGPAPAPAPDNQPKAAQAPASKPEPAPADEPQAAQAPASGPAPAPAPDNQPKAEQAPASKSEPAPANQPQAAQAPSSKPSPAPADEPQAAQAPASGPAPAPAPAPDNQPKAAQVPASGPAPAPDNQPKAAQHTNNSSLSANEPQAAHPPAALSTSAPENGTQPSSETNNQPPVDSDPLDSPSASNTPPKPDDTSPEIPLNATIPSDTNNNTLSGPKPTDPEPGFNLPTIEDPSPENANKTNSTASATSIYSYPNVASETHVSTEPTGERNSSYTSTSYVSATSTFSPSSIYYGTGYTTSTSLSDYYPTSLPTSSYHNATKTSYDEQPAPTGYVPNIGNSTTPNVLTSTYSYSTSTGTGYYPPFTSTSSYPSILNSSTISYGSGLLPTYTYPKESSSYAPSASFTLSSNTTAPTHAPTTTTPSVVIPTATNTGSTFMPSNIIAQTSAARLPGDSEAPISTGIPNALPKIVQNPMSGATPEQPADTSEVQIGFEYPLNYPFVVSHPLSTSQIFTYLPIGIADGLGLKSDQVVVKNLFPLDTTADLQFITTVARVYIPASMVDTLRVDLGIPVSKIYQNDDESVSTLMNYINPAIPFFPGGVMSSGNPNNNVKTTPGSTAKTGGDGIFNTDNHQNQQSAGAKGASAGIALAAFGGAAAYGAAMFLIARRYKQRHMRQKSSISYTSDSDSRGMRESSEGEASTAVMTGGRFSTYDCDSRGSGRTGNTSRSQISGPMMAENSLGWN